MRDTGMRINIYLMLYASYYKSVYTLAVLEEGVCQAISTRAERRWDEGSFDGGDRGGSR